MFRRLLTILGILGVSSTLFAASLYQLSDFESRRYGIDAQVVTVEGESFAQSSWSPDFKWRGFEIGFDLNVFVPFESGTRVPNELETFILRHVAYDHNNQHGFTWGRLRGLTLGQGLLMNNYDSGMGRSTFFNMEKAGFLGYTTYRQYKIEGLYTGTDVKGARVSGPVPKLVFWDVGVFGGITYLQDSDGIDYVDDGQRILRPTQEGIAVDLYWPLGGEFLTFFGEYAALSDRLHEDGRNGTQGLDGNGGSIGVRGDFLGMLYYKASYVRLGSGFVPGYFNSVYETTSRPDPLNSQENGYTAGLGAAFAGGKYRLGAEYERLGDRNLLTANAGWSQIGATSGVINYVIPYAGNQNQVVTADIAYQRGGSMDYVFHIKRVYTTHDDYVESYGVSTRVNLDKLIF